MQFNTKLNTFIQNMFKQINKKFIYLKIYFGSGIFFLFLGFLIGNLFGSLLNVFQESLVWQGCITLIIILFVEIVNYFMYDKTFLKIDLFNIETVDFKQKIIKPIYLINWKTIQHFFYQKILYFKNSKNFTSQIDFFLFYFLKFLYVLKKLISKIKNFVFQIVSIYLSKYILTIRKTKFFIKSLNFFKIGILLGFFIDAFKVGS